MRTVHTLVQGSPEWLAYRATVDGNASEAADMLGLNLYKSRDALIREKATGIAEDVDDRKQARFNDGHFAEANARPIAEKIIGEDLFQPTISLEVEGLLLSASIDGLTIDDEIAFEHKKLNANLRESLSHGVIPDEYHPQCEQVLMCSGASKLLFMASDGTEESALHAWYESNPELRARIIAGWKQFKIDVANYVAPEPTGQKAVAEPVASLPAINYQMDFSNGISISSNLEIFKKAAQQLVENSKAILVTDQDFENAKARIKECEKAEANIKSLVDRVLGELGDVSTFKSDLECIGEWIRQSRLNQDKQVKSRSAERKAEIIASGKSAAAAHIAEINGRLGSVQMPTVPVDFDAAVYRKSSFDSMQSSVNNALAAFKIEANRIANHIDQNLCLLREIASNHTFLFSDRQQLVLKDKDAVEAIARQRISEHEAAEKARIEAEAQRIADEKIAADKAAEAKRVADEKAAEEKRIADEAPAQSAQQKQAEPELIGIDFASAPIGISGRELTQFHSGQPVVSPDSKDQEAAILEREIPDSAVQSVARGGRSRPGDDMIVELIASHYGVTKALAISWLRQVNLDAVEKRCAA